MSSEIKKLKEQLHALQQEKEYFIGIASHDMQHPLSIINHACEVILSPLSSQLSPDHQKLIGFIHDAAKEMTSLFQNFLSVSRFENGKITVRLVKTDITKLTHKVAARYQEMAGKKNIGIYANSETTCYLLTDPGYLTRILENLLSNAVKYSLPDKNIYVNVWEKDNKIGVMVRDEGIGIPANEIPLLFEKFQHLSPKPTGGELSTGLGLNITKLLLDQLGGSIEVKSKVGEGSTFTIQFSI